MANVQKENGYFGVANELWEAISRAKFNGSERSCIDLILRLTYGCQKNGHNGEEAEIDKLSDFEVVGVHKQNVRPVLSKLTAMNIIRVCRIREPDERIKIRFNKDYDSWHISLVDRLERYNQLVKINVKDSNGQITKSNEIITDSNEDITPDKPKVMRLLLKSNEIITPKSAKANDSMDSQPPKDIKDINNNIINYIEGDKVLALIEKRTGFKWSPQGNTQLDKFNILMEFGEDKVLAAINKSLDTKPGLKGTGLIGYATTVVSNANNQPPPPVPREKPHEQVITEFARRLENIYDFFNVHDHDQYPAIDKLLAFNNETKVMELMANAKEQNLEFDSFDWIAAQMEGQS